MMAVRWGIAGLGRMAEVMAPEFGLAEGAEVVAAASRSADRARDFGARHGIERAHGSYADLATDDGVDAIYIATPHPQHRAIALEAIAAGKAVLVEKSMAESSEAVREIAVAARSAGVFCAEAMWTRWIPTTLALHEELAADTIGEVTGVQGDLQAFRAYNPGDRLFAPELGGGALLDLGVYPVAYAHDLLGAAISVAAHGSRMPNGVDGSAALSLGYAGGRTASLACGFTGHGPGRLTIFGTEGWIDVHPRMHHSETFTVHQAGEAPREVHRRIAGRGYHYMLTAVSAEIAAGATESDRMPLQASINVAEVLAQALTQF